MAAAPESADSSKGGGLIGWIDQRFPLTKLWKEQVSEYYAPKNFNFWYYFGSLAMLVLANQLVTGIFLTMHYKPSSAEAFASIEYIMRDVDGGWLIRYLHSTGASAFFIVMNRVKYDGLPADIRAAVDALSGDAWVAQFGPLWDKWDKPVREGANAPGHEVIIPDAATMAQWRAGLKPVTDRYIADLAAHGFPNARVAYDKLAAMLRR